MTEIITLNNGLRVWHMPVLSTRSIAIGVYVGAGSKCESSDNNGIAHFIEHMLFKGTKKRNAFQISEEMESKGIMINAYTAKANTAYYTISLDEYAEDCIEMLSDLYFNATFEEENIEKERGVVLEEINMSEDDSEDLCLELLSLAQYDGNPISRPILGTPATVKSFGKKEIRAFMDDYYTADNTVISIVGNITREKAIELVTKYFEFPAVRQNAKVNVALLTAEPKGEIKTKFKNNLEQANVAISFPQYSYFDEKSVVGSVVTNMLGGGMSSRLFQKLREELGIVYSVYASDYQYDKFGHTVIFLATNPSAVESAVSAVKDVITDIVKNGFSESEISKSKVQCKTSLILSSESSSFLMRAGGKRAILMNLPLDIDEKVRKIEEVDKQRIDSVTAEIFDFSKVAVSYVGKKSDVDLKRILRG